MAAGIDWFRWHHGSVTDPKFQLVARRAGASLPDVIAIWAALLETASQSSPRGSIESFDPEAYDVLFNFPEARSADVLAALTERGLLKGTKLVAWDKRQPKREREADDSTERVREHRRRKKEMDGVTPRNANETQETPREEKRREDLKAPLSLGAGDGAGEILVIDVDGNPTASAIAELTTSQSAHLVKACLALRKMGAQQFHPGDDRLAAIFRDQFTAEQVVRVVGEKSLRDAGLWDDPDLSPDLIELLINGATQRDMGLTDKQHLAQRTAVSQISASYVAATLRGRRRDAVSQQTGAGHGNARSAGSAGAGQKLSAVERVRAANAAAEQREQAAGAAGFGS